MTAHVRARRNVDRTYVRMGVAIFTARMQAMVERGIKSYFPVSAGHKRPNPSRDEEMPASSRDHSVHNVVPSDPAPTASSSSRGKHKQGQYDPSWEMKYDWVYPSDDGKGMFCKLCKRFNTHNERNASESLTLRIAAQGCSSTTCRFQHAQASCKAGA